jgi:CTP:molybdopterin cytidylyltransferase MocA
VLFARVHFPALRQLHGDKGGGALIKANGAALAQVRSRNRGVLIDIDTPQALAEAQAYALAPSE